MANQQLNDYVRQQLKLGVSRDAIRSALLGSGWTEADASEAFRLIAGDAAGSPGASAPVVPPVVPGAGTPIATRDIFQSKAEPMFQPKGSGKAEPVPEIKEVKKESKPVSATEPVSITMPRAASEPASPQRFSGGLIINVVFGVVVVGLLIVGGLLYKKNVDLAAQVAALTTQNSDISEENANLTQIVNDLQSQVSSLSAENGDLEAQLSIFVIPQTTPTAPLAVTARGTLAGGDGAPYSVTTNKGIVVYVKNSKDAAVDAALTPFKDKAVEISGTHAAGSRDITVTSVNGQAISTTGTSTPAAP